tara:strand:- start:456 stop:1268 length:813 start_codon:yes stop_codon:yes gene_type:complete
VELLFQFKDAGTTVKIASWNVNSVRARLQNILEWLSYSEIDVLLIQEIKCIADQFPRLEFESLGYEVALNGQKSYNGVAILSKLPMSEIVMGLPNYVEDGQSRYIEANVSGIVFSSIYLPNGNPIKSDKFNYKIAWMEKLKEHSKGLLDREVAVILGGDFNVVPDDNDVHDPTAWQNDALCQPETRKKYRELINLGFSDAFRVFNDTPGRYTFWDYQGGAWPKDHGVRIDHFLLSPHALDICSGCSIDTSPRGKSKASDHTPILVEIDHD